MLRLSFPPTQRARSPQLEAKRDSGADPSSPELLSAIEHAPDGGAAEDVAIATTSRDAAAGTEDCPAVLSPHAITDPSALSASVCEKPAAIAITPPRAASANEIDRGEQRDRPGTAGAL